RLAQGRVSRPAEEPGSGSRGEGAGGGLQGSHRAAVRQSCHAPSRASAAVPRTRRPSAAVCRGQTVWFIGGIRRPPADALRARLLRGDPSQRKQRRAGAEQNERVEIGPPKLASRNAGRDAPARIGGILRLQDGEAAGKDEPYGDRGKSFFDRRVPGGAAPPVPHARDPVNEKRGGDEEGER